MYKIAICEDEEIFANSLFEKISSILHQHNILFSINTYTSGEDFLKQNQIQELSFHLVFLDILMKNMNGIELAKLIRSYNDKIAIVFITATPEFSLQGYEVRALHYILKPVSNNDLSNILKYHYTQCFCNDFLTLKIGNTIRQLSFDEIIYMETKGRKVAIYLRNEIVYFSGKLSEIETSLPSHLFVRSHQSFILNIKKIKLLRQKEALTKSGISIPISRAHLTHLQKVFLENMKK